MKNVNHHEKCRNIYPICNCLAFEESSYIFLLKKKKQYVKLELSMSSIGINNNVNYNYV